MRRGFILGGHAVLAHPNGSIELIWTTGHGAHWSEEGERAYVEMRQLTMEAAATLYFAGRRKVVLDEGVALAVAEDDPRPGWPLGSGASIDVLLAQYARSRCELPEHGPGAADPG